MSSLTLVEIIPTIHLVLLIHGLNGKPEELFFLKRRLEHHEKGGKRVKVIVPKSNYKKTGDGIGVGAQRLFEAVLVEMTELEGDGKRVGEISLIGHSLGGIYARTLAGLLEAEFTFHDIIFHNFITIATPHLGARQHIILNESLTHHVGKRWYPKGENSTVLQLLLADSLHNKGECFMMKLVQDPFIKGLARFKNRTAYANIKEDYMVNYATSIISLHAWNGPNSLLTQTPVLFEEVRHGPSVKVLHHDYEQEMHQILNSLSWKKVACHTGRRFRGHTDCIVQKEDRDFKYGSHIIEHLVENFYHSD